MIHSEDCRRIHIRILENVNDVIMTKSTFTKMQYSTGEIVVGCRPFALITIR